MKTMSQLRETFRYLQRSSGVDAPTFAKVVWERAGNAQLSPEQWCSLAADVSEELAERAAS
jgi:hypothetical protein